MKLISLTYIINASILLLHEIESAYWKEWKILKLPGEITGFIIIHIPIIILIFYGLLQIEDKTIVGIIFGIITGVGGLAPFLVHKLLVKTENEFNLAISGILIYANIVTGLVLMGLSFYYLLFYFHF